MGDTRKNYSKMRYSDEQVEARKRERFEVMAVRLANHLNLSGADTYAKLPATARTYFDGLRYCDIVKPLIIQDNHAGLSVRQLSIKYGLSSTSIQNHLSRNPAPCE